jgi:hypothetical protein
MRRSWLFLAFAVLIFIDISILPMAVLLIYLGAILAPVDHGSWFPLTVFSAVVGAGLIWLTVIVGKALRRARPAPRSN